MSKEECSFLQENCQVCKEKTTADVKAFIERSLNCLPITVGLRERIGMLNAYRSVLDFINGEKK